MGLEEGTALPEYEDCWPCRLTGALAFTGLGSYLLYVRKSSRFEESLKFPAGQFSKRYQKSLSVLGVSFIAVGVIRLIMPAK